MEYHFPSPPRKILCQIVAPDSCSNASPKQRDCSSKQCISYNNFSHFSYKTDEMQQLKVQERQISSDSGYHALEMKSPSSFSLKSCEFSPFESPEPTPSYESRKTEFRYSKDRNQRFEYDSNESHSSTNGIGSHPSYTVSRRDCKNAVPGECNLINIIMLVCTVGIWLPKDNNFVPIFVGFLLRGYEAYS